MLLDKLAEFSGSFGTRARLTETPLSRGDFGLLRLLEDLRRMGYRPVRQWDGGAQLLLRTEEDAPVRETEQAVWRWAKQNHLRAGAPRSGDQGLLVAEDTRGPAVEFTHTEDALSRRLLVISVHEADTYEGKLSADWLRSRGRQL